LASWRAVQVSADLAIKIFFILRKRSAEEFSAAAVKGRNSLFRQGKDGQENGEITPIFPQKKPKPGKMAYNLPVSSACQH
jgi:hypothetical protein